jgi:tRNA1(Val) A37 N6-methylase TrmN6
MKTFQIPGFDIDFFQHEESQAASSDSYWLYQTVKTEIRFLINNDEDPQLYILDIGCGSGVISLMLASEFPTLLYTGIDIVPDLAVLANENFKKLSHHLQYDIVYSFYHSNYASMLDPLEDKSYHVIVANPPYIKYGAGKSGIQTLKNIARSEIYATQVDLLKYIKNHLSHIGSAFVIYPTARETELERNCSSIGLLIERCFTSDNSRETKQKKIWELRHVDI